MEQDVSDPEMVYDDDQSDLGEYEDKEEEENDLDDQSGEDEQQEDEDHEEEDQHNDSAQNTVPLQHITIPTPTPAATTPHHPVAMLPVTQPSIVIPVKVGTLPLPNVMAQPPLRMTLPTQLQHPLSATSNQVLVIHIYHFYSPSYVCVQYKMY